MSYDMSVMNTTQLALFGGPPAVTSRLLSAGRRPPVLEWVKRDLIDLLDTGQIADPEPTRDLEKAFASYTGAKHCLSMVNGTAAIRAGLWVLGVGQNPDDEVICPSLTSWSAVMPIVSVGAKVVFADVEAATLSLDPRDVLRRITSKTKAVIVAHMLGMSADLDELVEICKIGNVPLIEDACLAEGVRYRGRHVGTFGAFGCFSLQSGKALSAGEGGLLVTNDSNLYQRAVLCGHPKRVDELSPEHLVYRHTPLGGVKNRLNSVTAIIALGALEQLDDYLKMAATATSRFINRIKHLKGVGALKAGLEVCAAHHYPVILYDADVAGVSCDQLIRALTAEGVPVERRLEAQHRHVFFVERDYDPDDLPVTCDCADRVLRLPRLHYATEEMVDQCVEAFRKVWGQLDVLNDSQHLR